MNPKPATSLNPLKGTPWQSLLLSHETSEPYYRQLQRQIKQLISSGKTPGGSSLPSERDLASALGLSRTTVKRCYDELRGHQPSGHQRA